MLKINKILLLLCFLFYKNLCFAVDFKENNQIESSSVNDMSSEYTRCLNTDSIKTYIEKKEDSNKEEANDTSLIDIGNIESDLKEINTKEEKNNTLIFELCNNILQGKNFLLPNSNWLLIKIFFALLAPLCVGSSNLTIAANSNITTELILLSQFGVALYINNIFTLLDKIRFYYKSSNIKKKLIKLQKKLHISIYLCLNLFTSICLGYLSAWFNFKLSGDGYAWMFTNFTNSKTILSLAYYFGYITKLIFLLPLNTVFFFNLIEEFFTKTGIGKLLKICPSATASKHELSYKKHIKQLNKIIKYDDFDYSMNKIKKYLSENRMNTTLDIANIQLYCFDKQHHNGKLENVLINIFKLIFITTTTIICGESFKQVYASKLLLKNYITSFANSTINNTYTFTLKDNSLFSCDSIEDCIKTLNFNQIPINDEEVDYIVSANLLASISFILCGIGTSSHVATMLIEFIHYTKKMIKNQTFRATILSSFLRKQNIIPLLFAGSISIPAYYYMQNIYNVLPIAEQSNNLFTQIGKKSFMPVSASVIVSILYLEFTYFSGTVFLVDMSRLLISKFDKLWNTRWL